MKRGGNGIRICLPLHCLSAPPDLQPYQHTIATFHSLLKRDQIACDNRLPVHFRRVASRRRSAVVPCRHANIATPCIYAVKLLSGPSLGVFGSYYLVQVGFLEVIIWSKFVFLAYKNSGFKRFVLHTQLSFCVFFLSPIFWQFSKNSLFQKKGAKIGFSNFQCFKFKFWKFSFFRFAKTL